MHLPDETTPAALAAPESEKKLVVAIMAANSGWMTVLSRTIHTAEMFKDRECRSIWEALVDLHERMESISADSVASWLRHNRSCPDLHERFLQLTEENTLSDMDSVCWHAQQIGFAYARRVAVSTSLLGDMAAVEPKEVAEALQQLRHAPCSTSEDVPRPLPLGGALPPVKPFDTAWLPNDFRPWIADIAERMQCPPEFPAVAAMAALSSVAGRRFCIQPKVLDQSYTEFPHLWAMLIGNPSLMKSPAMQAAMRPLRTLETEAFQNHTSMDQDRQAAEIAAKIKRSTLQAAARKAVLKGDSFDYTTLIDTHESTTPMRRFIVNDASVEALGEVLMENQTGTLLYQDELAGLFALLEKDGNQSLRAFLLQAWSGKEGFTFDRIGRGRRHVPACAVSLLGSIQPGVIAAHIRAAQSNTAGADGFLQRFSLMVWPDVSPSWTDIDRSLDGEVEFQASNVFLYFENLQRQQLLQAGAVLNADGIPTFRFAPDAQERFKTWRSELEHRLRSGRLPAAFEAHLGKYRKLVPALAVLIHVAEDPTAAIQLSALERALSWADCLESHAVRVFGSGAVAESDAVHALLRRLRDGTAGLPAEFKARDVRNKCWSGLTRVEDVESACELLMEHRWLIATARPASSQGGRPTVTYRLNPLAEHAA